MARNKFSSPVVRVDILPENYAEAVRSKSGGCLIADGIKKKYPQFTGIVVDMATVRFTDRKEGRRYTYLTPAVAQHLLLSFDQGWSQPPVEEILIRRAVKITPVTTSATKKEKKAARMAELETKEADGTLTGAEKAALTRMRAVPPRPTTTGKTEVKLDDEHGHTAVVAGGRAVKQGPPHPNLLRGSDRHFGAKLADPGQAFREAVEEALAQHLADLEIADDVAHEAE